MTNTTPNTQTTRHALCNWCNNPPMHIHNNQEPLCKQHYDRRQSGWEDWMMGLPGDLRGKDADTLNADTLFKLAWHGVTREEVAAKLAEPHGVEPGLLGLLVGRRPLVEPRVVFGVTG